MPARSDARQVEQVVVNAVLRAFLLQHRRTVRLPRPIEQREHAVVEQVEEIAEARCPSRGASAAACSV